ncbi:MULTISPECIES: prolyl-tRNA synthetase associated domain-containing protein [Romboutsia]|uniref:YbaK/proline--tRNA ligase associated domain protein n=1 Tax=Romboutsia hominis TaxID=1507512 RepID=A0A2P2BRS4_9FIRM|nr:prolyl-tRNA synthetase associated domain-containing protein [Romboutsia hominis]CEI73061.1 YbaK/proline--tRNA ligase associated domain protein [Romboutsia hominis]
MNIETKVYKILDDLNIEYEVFEHEPIYTAEQLEIIKDVAKGNHCKNLFLKNSKGDRYYLVVVRDDKKADLKILKEQLGSTRLSFASAERLYDTLKLTPGSVNPFSIINDEEKKVTLCIDKDVLDGQNLNFHPNINTKMVNLSSEGLKKFVHSMGYDLIPVEV